MSSALARIEEEALALTPEERAHLVDTLWDSLGDTSYPVLSESWSREIEHRHQRLVSKEAKAVKGEEVSRRAWEIAGPQA
jgi:putative addiction module component (TIGR02574 family)